MNQKLDNQELYRSAKEDTLRKNMAKLFRNCPIPDDDILQNLGLFLSSKNLSRILFFDHIYQKIIDVPGVIFDLGARWGQVSSVCAALRGIYEPFNRHRKIVAFDTFSGFPSISDKDNKTSRIIKIGGLATSKNYEKYLEAVLTYQEQDNPISHIKKFEIKKGDASIEIDKYFKKYPETIVSLAFFDFDIYEPTKKCLEAIRPHLIKGSVIAFDELNDRDSPGETIALKETLGLNNLRIKRFRYASRVSYFIFE